MKRVRDLMTEEVETVTRRESLANVQLLMIDRGFRHVPVVENDEVIGIISDRDIATVLADTARAGLADQLQRIERMTAAEVMTHGVETVDPDEELAIAADTMLANKISCLPVVEGAHLVGILTESDFVKHYASHA